MVCCICKDRNDSSRTFGMTAQFYFSELFELLASLHVICNPSHHGHRQKWWMNLKKELNEEIYEQIVFYSHLTKEWMIPMDFCDQLPYVAMDIEEIFDELDKLSLAEWNYIFIREQRKCSQNQKAAILCLWKTYYENYFKQELLFLKPLLVRALEKESTLWKTSGFEVPIKSLHTRLKLEENEFIFFKNKEYHFPYDKIKTIYFTASTFLDPHLILGERENALSLVRAFHAKAREINPPHELTFLHYALSDGTRLCILRILRKHARTTKQLSDQLKISPAGISKQLKVLLSANLVRKKRQGYNVYYILEVEELDFLTYRIFEFLG